MNKLIKQFIEKLNSDGVLSEEMIKQFETFGIKISKMLKEAEEEGYEKAKEEAEEEKAEMEKEKEDEMAEVEESFKRILAKIDEVKAKEQQLALMKFKEHFELSVKEEKIVEMISKYLNEAVNEHLPEQPIVDYAELDRLRKTFKNIKEAVLITDSDVQSKVSSVMEDIESELTEKSNLLNSAIARNIEYRNELNTLKAEKLLSEKLKDIPEFERRKLRKHFKESTVEEIDSEFDNVLEQIQLKEYDIERKPQQSSVIKEDVDLGDDESDMDRYARYTERFIPRQKR